MQNNQRLPIFRPAESEEWKDLQQSLGLRDVINAP
jgi:hypothetical protein